MIKKYNVIGKYKKDTNRVKKILSHICNRIESSLSKQKKRKRRFDLFFVQDSTLSTNFKIFISISSYKTIKKREEKIVNNETGSLTLDTLSRELLSETRNMIETAVGRAENSSFRGLKRVKRNRVVCHARRQLIFNVREGLNFSEAHYS